MSQAPRVTIDDDDSGITYTGSWFRDQGSFSTLGNFGAPIFDTLHGTNSGGSLSYQFVGSSVTAKITLLFPNSKSLAMQCLVDNENISLSPLPAFPENDVELCTQSGLSDGPHNFTVIANVTNQETFWFDHLDYIPSSSVALDQATLLFPWAASQVQSGFGMGWTPFSPGSETQQTGAQFHFNFTGVSLIWYGFYDPSLPWDTSLNTATYSVDGGAPIPFNTMVNAPSITSKPTSVAYNQLLFQTADFPYGNHTLEVVYRGNNTTTPLTLEFCIIRRTASSEPSTESLSTTPAVPTSKITATTLRPQVSPSTDPITPSHKSHHTGTIVGATMGVLGFLSLAAILFLCLRRRRDRFPSGRENRAHNSPPDMYQPSPFPIARADPISSSTSVMPSKTNRPHHGSHGHDVPAPRPSADGLFRRQGSLTILNPFQSLSPSPSRQKGGAGDGRVRSIRDQDSGIRLNSDGDEVEILPPVYTVV